MSAGEKISILFLGSNPFNASQPLNLDGELRGIQDALQRSLYRDRFELRIAVAARIDDMYDAMLAKPHIVHFAGHGENGGIYLQDELGNKVLVSGRSLAKLFSKIPSVKCVVLNACYSEELAQALTQHVSYIIGMRSAVQDPAAIAFAGAFYNALGSGSSYPDAFGLAVSKLELLEMLDADTPVLHSNPEAKVAVNTTFRSAVPQLSRLNGAQYKALHAAMAAHYNPTTLPQMVQTEFDVPLWNVAGGSDHSAIVFNFIDWAQRNGQLQKLLQVCARSSDPNLQNTTARLGQIS